MGRSVITSVQIGFRSQEAGGVEISGTALLSQEGSTIETAVEIVRGVVPEPHSLRMHSETFRLGNHPSRHCKERDGAALLTQEGNPPVFSVIESSKSFEEGRVSRRRRSLESAAWR